MKNNNLTHTLMQIAQLSKSVEIDFDQNGYLRSLTTTNKGGLQQLYSCPITNNLKAKVIDEIDAFFIAHQFINTSVIKSDLQLANTELEIGDITPFAFGYRINCEQMATYGDKKTLLPVHGGALHIAINKAGEFSPSLPHCNMERLNLNQKLLSVKQKQSK